MNSRFSSVNEGIETATGSSDSTVARSSTSFTENRN